MARLRGSCWQADIRDKAGKRHRHTFPTKQEAIAWEAQARLASSQGKPLPVVPSFIKKNPHTKALDTIGGLFDYVSRTAWGNAKSVQTLLKNGRDVVAYFHSKTPIKSITTQDIENFKTYLSSQKLAKPATINRKLSALSKLLKTAYGMGLIERMPIINWERENKTKFRYLNEEEEKRLLDYFHYSEYLELNFMGDMCMFLLDTGARLSEFWALKRSSFSSSGRCVTFWETKTGRPRTVPLTSRCQSLVDRQSQLQAYLLAHERGEKFYVLDKSSLFRKLWGQMQKNLGWPDVTPHTLRHTCCTRLIQRGVDIKRVMEWMGHTNINTTQRYMQISPQGLEQVVHVLEQENNEIMPAAA